MTWSTSASVTHTFSSTRIKLASRMTIVPSDIFSAMDIALVWMSARAVNCGFDNTLVGEKETTQRIWDRQRHRDIKMQRHQACPAVTTALTTVSAMQ